jgi:hypothetical protein
MHRTCQLLFDRDARELIKPGMNVMEIGTDQIPSQYYGGSV